MNMKVNPAVCCVPNITFGLVEMIQQSAHDAIIIT